MTPRRTIRPSLFVPAPPLSSLDWGFWGVRKGLKGQAQGGLAVNLKGGKAVLGRLGEALGRVKPGLREGKAWDFRLKTIGYIYNLYIGEFREGI